MQAALTVTKMEKMIIRKAYLGGKDPESGVLNMLGGRYLLDPRRAT